jgi:3-methylcrotonyl-CoA carboxylase alpha subunit
MAKQTLRLADRDYIVEVTKNGILVEGELVAPAPHAYAVADGDKRWVFLDGDVYEFDVQRLGRRRSSAHHSSLMAPMPATVTRINVAVGDAVARGDTLLVLEAMKMELPVRAPSDGTISSIACREGELVQPGVPLIELDGQ